MSPDFHPSISDTRETVLTTNERESTRIFLEPTLIPCAVILSEVEGPLTNTLITLPNDCGDRNGTD